MKKSLFGLILFGLSLVAMTAPAHAAGKISMTPTGLNLVETQSTSVEVKLDAPLVGPGTPYLHINITASDPSRVSIDSTPVDYAPLEWSQAKHFTITALDDGVHNASNTVTITFTADSSSLYYNLYTGSFVLSLTDINPAPDPVPTTTTTSAVQTTTTSTATTPKATLAETGQETAWVQAVSLSALLASVLLLRRLVRTSK